MAEARSVPNGRANVLLEPNLALPLAGNRSLATTRLPKASPAQAAPQARGTAAEATGQEAQECGLRL